MTAKLDLLPIQARALARSWDRGGPAFDFDCDLSQHLGRSSVAPSLMDRHWHERMVTQQWWGSG